MALWTPAELANALVWLDPDTKSAGAIASFDNPFGTNATMVSGTPTIVTNEINGHNVLRFNGSSYLGFNAALAAAGTVSIFHIQRNTSAIDTAYVMFNYSNSTYSVVASSGDSETILTQGFGTPTFYQDGNLKSWANRGQVWSDLGSGVTLVEQINVDITQWLQFYISGYVNAPSFFFTGDFGDLIIIPGEATTAIRQLIEGWACHKYGIAGSLPIDHPYKSTAPQIVPLWTPANIPTALWLDASDSSTITESGGAVSEWRDKSGNGVHAVQVTGTLQPAVSVAGLNGRDVLNFAGDRMTAPLVVSGTAFTAYAVVTLAAASNDHARLLSMRQTGQAADFNNAGSCIPAYRYAATAQVGSYYNSVFRSYDTLAYDTAVMLSSVFATNSIQLFINGTGKQISSVTQAVNSTDGIMICDSLSANTENWHGLVAEIVYVLNDNSDTRTRMEGYLAHKWGLTASLPAGHPYKSAPPEVSGSVFDTFRGGLAMPIEYTTTFRGGLAIPLVHDFRGGLVIPVSCTDRFRGGLRLPVDYVRPYRGGVRLPIECSTLLRGGLAMPVKLSAGLRGGLPLPVTIIGATYLGGLPLPVEMPAMDTYRGGLKMVVACEPDISHSYVDTVSVILSDGTLINPHYIRTKYHIDDAYIDGEIRLAVITDFIRCPRGTLLTIEYNGEFEQVMVEHAYRRRPEIVDSRYEVEYVLKLTAPAERRLDSPWAMPMQVELGPGMASEIAIALAAAEGVSLSWQIVDEFIPAGTLYANSETAGQVIRKLAGEWGGCMQTEPDGTVEVVPYYSRAVDRWANGVADLYLSDDVDIHSMSESPDPRPGYNSVRVLDQISPQASANLDFEEVSATEQIIYRRKVPFDPEAVINLRCSRPDQVTIEPLGVITQQFDDELVTIEAGTGSTRYPIHQLLGKQYADIPLGYIIPSEDGALVTELSGQSLVLISYTTRAMAWRVRSTVLSDVLWWTEV